MSESASALYEESKEELWDHMSNEHNCCLLESECFELWQVATQSCRKEIQRLERLVAFHFRGRSEEDAERQNDNLNAIVCRLRDL